MATASIAQMWRALCAAEYRALIIDGGNDGPPESDVDPWPARERAQTLAVGLSTRTGIPAAQLRALACDAAWQHGQDPGTDADPDRFAPPDFARMRST